MANNIKTEKDFQDIVNFGEDVYFDFVPIDITHR